MKLIPIYEARNGHPDHRLRVLLLAYALALLLATFIFALHAGILFSLADFLTLLAHWAMSSLGDRAAGILVLLAAISGLFVAHVAEASTWAAFIWSRVTWPRLATAGISSVSHTTLGYGNVVLQKPWRSLGPICAINGLLNFGCSTATLFLTRRASDQARYIVRAGGLREIDAGGPASLENFG